MRPKVSQRRQGRSKTTSGTSSDRLRATTDPCRGRLLGPACSRLSSRERHRSRRRRRGALLRTEPRRRRQDLRIRRCQQASHPALGCRSSRVRAELTALVTSDTTRASTSRLFRTTDRLSPLRARLLRSIINSNPRMAFSARRVHERRPIRRRTPRLRRRDRNWAVVVVPPGSIARRVIASRRHRRRGLLHRTSHSHRCRLRPRRIRSWSRNLRNRPSSSSRQWQIRRRQAGCSKRDGESRRTAKIRTLSSGCRLSVRMRIRQSSTATSSRSAKGEFRFVLGRLFPLPAKLTEAFLSSPALPAECTRRTRSAPTCQSRSSR